MDHLPSFALLLPSPYVLPKSLCNRGSPTPVSTHSVSIYSPGRPSISEHAPGMWFPGVPQFLPPRQLWLQSYLVPQCLSRHKKNSIKGRTAATRRLFQEKNPTRPINETPPWWAQGLFLTCQPTLLRNKLTPGRAMEGPSMLLGVPLVPTPCDRYTAGPVSFGAFPPVPSIM